ncbi:MAG: DNA-processing protein DprA [Planctomycetaceae bacterium]|nr:DNA-processing protein DprA [Planctomycetaceae bacterium]
MTTPPAILDDILLSLVEGIGARTYQRLLEKFGTATEILNATRSDLGGFDFLKPDTLAQLTTARNRLDPTHIVELCEKDQIDILSLRDKRYPAQLRTITDPPPILYVKGTLLSSDSFSIAVIGTRRCTRYGERQTERLTSALVQNGFAIISGLALGIDGIAHRAALKSSGRTIAVLGSGLQQIYPSEHKPLAEKIIDSGGCVVSEYPPLHPSTKWTFPQRNRIVCGLSLGVLVIEAPVRSGAMISARLAGEQGRDIFAVPGSIESQASSGCHQLIRDGAYLTESADDILDVLGPMRQPVLLPGIEKPVRHPNEVSLNEMEHRVLQCVGGVETSFESIVTASELEPQQALAVLTVLERKRIIRQITPTSFVRM